MRHRKIWRSLGVGRPRYCSGILNTIVVRCPRLRSFFKIVHQAVQQFSAGGYVNYLDPPTSALRYFGSNLAQLTAICQKYDPNRIMFSGFDF